MVSIDEFETMIQKIVDTLPEELFTNLNGGVLILSELKIHPQAIQNDLYIMGEYHYDSFYGRYVSMYYGSFMKMFSHLDEKELYEKIEHTIKHELVHHLESQAGIKDLEIWDRDRLEEYEENVRRIEKNSVSKESK